MRTRQSSNNISRDSPREASSLPEEGQSCAGHWSLWPTSPQRIWSTLSSDLMLTQPQKGLGLDLNIIYTSSPPLMSKLGPRISARAHGKPCFQLVLGSFSFCLGKLSLGFKPENSTSKAQPAPEETSTDNKEQVGWTTYDT